MWADVIPLHDIHVNGNGTHRHPQPETRNSQAKTAFSGTPLRQTQPQGQPWNGPIQFGSKVAEHMVQVGYNAQHKIPWHWPVPAYLVTKGLAAGLFILLGLGWAFGWFAHDPVTAVIGGFVSLLFMGLTTAFLVIDLEKPERFLYILLRPQWNSWLARGAIFLVGFSTLATFWWLFELGGWLFNYDVPLVRAIFTWAGMPLAIGVAVYTAFLFAQAEGRDLWQSPLLPFHLVVQALMMGSSAMLILGWLIPSAPAEMVRVATITLTVSLLVDLFVTLIGEFSIPHPSEVAARAAHEISSGRYRRHFWIGSITIGHLLPLALLLISDRAGFDGFLLAVAAACVAGGLYLYEYAFVMAPQEIPNS